MIQEDGTIGKQHTMPQYRKKRLGKVNETISDGTVSGALINVENPGSGTSVVRDPTGTVGKFSSWGAVVTKA